MWQYNYATELYHYGILVIPLIMLIKEKTLLMIFFFDQNKLRRNSKWV